MSFLPRNAVFDPALFRNGASGIAMPSLHEARYDLIDAAAETYHPLYEVLGHCLRQYGFETFHAWLVSDDHGSALAVMRSLCHPAVWPEADPLDGLLDPVAPAIAKRNLVVWSLGRTLGSYKTFARALRAQNHGRKFELSDMLAMFRTAARADARRFEPEDFTWPAQRQFIRSCLEGSNRSKQGRSIEERAREALRALQSSGWLLRVGNGEVEVEDALGIRHRTDILIENDTHVLIVHVKSSQLIRHGYSGIYARETAETTAAVVRTLAGDRSVASMTIFAGHGWNGDRIPGISNPMMAPDLVGLTEDAQRAWFLSALSASPLLEPFRGQGEILGATAVMAPTSPASGSSESAPLILTPDYYQGTLF